MGSMLTSKWPKWVLVNGPNGHIFLPFKLAESEL